MNCDQSAGGGGSTCVGSTGPGPKVDYNVQIEPDGSMSGYAWSSIAGWIRFGGLTGYPTGTGVADQSATAVGTYPNLDLVGWARACAGASNPAACSGGTNINAGGWDGWIALAGSASGGYEVSFTNGSADNNANSYAWGGPNTMGWIDFSPSVNGTVIPVTLRTQTDIVINAFMATPGPIDVNGLSAVALLADVTGLPNSMTAPYEVILGGVVVESGTVTGATPLATFSGPMLLTGVAYSASGPLSLEIDMPVPGVVPETDDVNVASASLTLTEPDPEIIITGPDVIRSGETASFMLDVTAPYPFSCMVGGPIASAPPSPFGANGAIGSPANANGTFVSAPLRNATRFEVTCTSANTGITYTKVFRVEVIPTFQEI